MHLISLTACRTVCLPASAVWLITHTPCGTPLLCKKYKSLLSIKIDSSSHWAWQANGYSLYINLSCNCLVAGQVWWTAVVAVVVAAAACLFACAIADEKLQTNTIMIYLQWERESRLMSRDLQQIIFYLLPISICFFKPKKVAEKLLLQHSLTHALKDNCKHSSAAIVWREREWEGGRMGSFSVATF